MKPKKTKKPSEIVFADRVIMSLANDVANLLETAERIKIQMDALATERGIKIV